MQAPEETVQSCFLTCASFRVGAPLPAPALFVRTRKGRSGQRPETDRNTDKNLVPKQTLQNKAETNSRTVVFKRCQKGGCDFTNKGRKTGPCFSGCSAKIFDVSVTSAGRSARLSLFLLCAIILLKLTFCWMLIL